MKPVPEKLKKRYTWFKQHSALEKTPGFALEIISDDRPGLIADMTAAIHRHEGNLAFFQSWNEYDGKSHTLLQIDNDCCEKTIMEQLSAIKEVRTIKHMPTNINTWGKRIIIIGGGAQVASVASGAIAEADRHNIRGETISVDTTAIVGEKEIANTILAVGKLHRAGMLVLAGALMGGEITKAVKTLREEYGIPVLALRMAGSVTKEADLVVTDPIEAGVMAVMLISNIGKFNLLMVEGKQY